MTCFLCFLLHLFGVSMTVDMLSGLLSVEYLCSGFTGTQLLANVLLQREGQRQEGQEQALVEGALPLPRRENRACRQCF